MKNYLTKRQMKDIIELGFKNSKLYDTTDYELDEKTGMFFLSTTVDNAIDFLRIKYDIVIYNSMEPFVDPTAKKACIVYRFSVKQCNLRDGWNGRIHIGKSALTKNIYAAKRQAITIAINWIKKRKKCSKKMK